MVTRCDVDDQFAMTGTSLLYENFRIFFLLAVFSQMKFDSLSLCFFFDSTC